MLYRIISGLVLLVLMISCGKAVVLQPTQNSGVIAPALDNGIVINMDMDTNAQVGQPFNLTFTVIPTQNTQDATIKVTIDPRIEILSGSIEQANVQLVGNQPYAVPLTLRINDLSTPLEIGCNVSGSYPNNYYTQGGLGYYLKSESGKIVTTHSLVETMPTLAPNQLPPVDTIPMPLLTEPVPPYPYPVNNEPTPLPQSR